MASARVLIAEDNELIALTLEEQLINFGYEVAGVARTGNEAMRLCVQLKPDIVLMDMQMPEVSGDVATEYIVHEQQTPVVILTAYSDAEHIRRAEESGALAYLVKPVNPEELPPTIDVALARFREMQQLREKIDTLQDTIESRKVAERAKGILMKRRKLTEREAQELLEQRAHERGCSVKDIAQAIIEAEALWS
jgi:AmiR/NasT family two-component response regulator